MPSVTNNGFILRTELTTISQNIDRNTSVINIKLILNVGHSFQHRSRFKLILDSDEEHPLFVATDKQVNGSRNQQLLLVEKQATVHHISDGSRVVSIKGAFETIQKEWYTPSSELTTVDSYTLQQIPRKSDFTNIVTNPHSNNAAIFANCDIKSPSFENVWELHYYTNNVKKVLHTLTRSGSYSYTITRSQLDELARLVTERNYAILHLKLTTRSKSTGVVIGDTTRNIHLYFSSEYAPTINSVTLTELNSGVTALGLPANSYVQNVSKIRVVLNVSFKQGAVLRSQTINNAVLIKKDYMEVVATNHGSLQLNYKVTDSRGLTASGSRTIMVFPYEKPKITQFLVSRSNNGQGNKCEVRTQVYFNTLNNRNHLTIRYNFREKGSNSWLFGYLLNNLTETPHAPQNALILQGDFASEKYYEVQIVVSDRLNSISVTNEISSARVVTHFGSHGLAIGGLLSNFFHRGLQVYGTIVDEFGVKYAKLNPELITYINQQKRSMYYDSKKEVEDYLFTNFSTRQDFNNLYAPGHYFFAADAVLQQCTNKPPTTMSGTLTVYSTNKISKVWQYPLQEYRTRDGQLFSRYANGNAQGTLNWSNWVKKY